MNPLTVLAIACALSMNAQPQTSVSLEFNTDGVLPSASHGFQYVTGGNPGQPTTGAPEASVYSVSGGLLHMNTAALGTNMGFAHYEKAGLFDPTKDVLIEMRLALFSDSAREFHIMARAQDLTYAGLIFENSQMIVLRNVPPNPQFPVADTLFHNYRIYYRAATRAYEVFVDGVQRGGAEKLTYTGAPPNQFIFGDAGGSPGFNGRADVDYIRITTNEPGVFISPNRGGNAGTVTAQITFGRIQSGATVKLAGLGADIAGTNTTGPNGPVLTSTFDLRGATPGPRTLVITNPDSTTESLPNAFTVEAGGAARIRTTKTGTTAVPGRALEYFIVIENEGNIDGDGTLMEALEPWFTYISAEPLPAKLDLGRDTFPDNPPAPLYTAFLQWPYLLASGQSRVIRYRAQLDAQLPIGDGVRGCACNTPNAEQAEIGRDLYELQMWQAKQQPVRAVRKAMELLACRNLIEFCGGGAAHEQAASAPVDPNEKLTSHPRYIKPDQRLTYPIHYENIGNAEARDVFITDVLDQNLDVSTLQLLTPGATLDTGTRTIRWNLLNRNLPPQGTDNVLLSVKPMPNLPSGTAIRNKATIQFEVFAPLTTNETVNIIDSTPPQCAIQPLPAQLHSTAVPLRWTGSDAIGEIDFHAIRVSTDGGAFAPFLDRSQATSSTFNGVIGRSYRFQCQATDTAGNVEVQADIAEATTRIVLAGDVNADGTVTCADLSIVRASFGRRTGQAGFDSRADVNNDGVVDVRDMSFVSQKLPAGTQCP